MSRITPCTFESLEARKHLAATPVRITGLFTDNRGQTEVFFSQALNPASLTKKSIRVLSAGADGQFGTADDRNIARGVGYKKGRLVINANLPANTRYRVRLGGLKGTNGLQLDGEFNGMGRWTGNGVAGGIFDVTTQTAAKPKARFNTSLGFINVSLYLKPTPKTLANFKRYSDEKAWDGTFFHRSVRQNEQGIGVVQGGGFNVKNGEVDVVTPHAGIDTESSQNHLKGTIAMARADSRTSNTNQWFFNVTANPSLDRNYTAFGVVSDVASQRVIENINKLTIVNAGAPFGELPVRVQRQTIQVPGDLVMVNRVAMLMDVRATPVGTAQAAQAGVSPAAATVSAFSVKAISGDSALVVEDDRDLLDG